MPNLTELRLAGANRELFRRLRAPKLKSLTLRGHTYATNLGTLLCHCQAVETIRVDAVSARLVCSCFCCWSSSPLFYFVCLSTPPVCSILLFAQFLVFVLFCLSGHFTIWLLLRLYRATARARASSDCVPCSGPF